LSTHHILHKIFVLPLTSKTKSLQPGEFLLKDWRNAGLNVETAVKRSVYTVHQNLIVQSVGRLSALDLEDLDDCLR